MSTVTSQTSKARRPRPAAAGSPARLGALAVAGGAVIAAVAHLVALAAGAEMLVPALDGEGTQQLATAGVAASAAGAALIGWAAAWGARRFTRKPRAVWVALALIGLALSFVPVVAIEATAITKAVLALQHLLVAGVVIPLLARTLPAGA
jgi:large exoprotein involved in heme utilization and adhesion